MRQSGKGEGRKSLITLKWILERFWNGWRIGEFHGGRGESFPNQLETCLGMDLESRSRIDDSIIDCRLIVQLVRVLPGFLWILAIHYPKDLILLMNPVCDSTIVTPLYNIISLLSQKKGPEFGPKLPPGRWNQFPHKCKQ